MDKVIVYTNSEGKCCIVQPAPKSPKSLEEIAKQAVPKGIKYVIMDRKDIPKDRHFRNAWEMEKKSIVCNLSRCKDIHMQHIREARDKKLAELDLEMVRAMELDKDTERRKVAAKKQKLRDLPETVDLEAAKNEHELKLIWPDELK